MMSVKRYKLARSSSSKKIRKATKILQGMSTLQQIELMVKAGTITLNQADRARKKLEETVS